MYETILMPVDGTSTDRAIIEHIKLLAKTLGSRVVVFHVATSVAAQWHGGEAGGEKVEEGESYLNAVKAEFEAIGVPAEAELAFGEPVREIVRRVHERGCDLVAMSTHGHRLVGDLFLGTTASPVQHQVNVPVLLLRAK
ncbi:MAG: universal stress protein [Planctomycetaceae bacterium]|nr:universal stress protein [Planctomycetaceae bacterium]